MGKILHRDVSENNIIITELPAEGAPKGRLIDLDLAKELDSMPSGARHRTGTMQFMAIEVLEGKGHTYRHDLESFFYVFVWTCIRYGYKGTGKQKPIKVPKTNILRGWYTGMYRKLRGTKWVIWAKTDSRTSSWSLHRSSRTSNRWLASSDPLFFQLEMATSSRAHSTTVI